MFSILASIQRKRLVKDNLCPRFLGQYTHTKKKLKIRESKIHLALILQFIHSLTHPIIFSEYLLSTLYSARHCGRLKDELEKHIKPTEGGGNKSQTVMNALMREQIQLKRGRTFFLLEASGKFVGTGCI